MAAIMLQTTPSFDAKISEKKSLYFCKNIWIYIICKNYCIAHPDVKTCFLPLVKIPLYFTRVYITLYYLEKLRNCYIYLINFVSRNNTWTSFTLSSSTNSAEKILQRVEMCLTMCREQSLLNKETEDGTKCRALRKRGSWEKSLISILWVLCKRTNQHRLVVQCLQKE